MTDFEEKFQRALEALESVGKSYANAKVISWYLQELKKVILAHEMSKVEGSEAKRERLALASEPYRLHLEGTKEAIGEELRLKVKHEKLQYQIEAYRSLCGIEKAQMNLAR